MNDANCYSNRVFMEKSFGNKKFLAIDDCYQIHLLDSLRHDKKTIIDACSDI